MTWETGQTGRHRILHFASQSGLMAEMQQSQRAQHHCILCVLPTHNHREVCRLSRLFTLHYHDPCCQEKWPKFIEWNFVIDEFLMLILKSWPSDLDRDLLLGVTRHAPTRKICVLHRTLGMFAEVRPTWIRRIGVFLWRTGTQHTFLSCWCTLHGGCDMRHCRTICSLKIC